MLNMLIDVQVCGVPYTTAANMSQPPEQVGVTVKADASFSVSRALQLQLPKQLAVLEEVSEYASREYSLERALDKMQVC